MRLARKPAAVHKRSAGKPRAVAPAAKSVKPAGRFAPVAREPAYTLVASAIEAKILQRELNDGDVLPPENDLAQQFQVHRSTVREALRRLESAGLITRPPGAKRMIVSRPHVEKIASGMRHVMVLHDVTFHEVWESMTVLEPEVAAFAAARRSIEQLDQLTKLNDAFANSSTDDTEAVRLVASFFETMGDCAANQVLRLAKRPLAQVLAPSLARMIVRVPQARKRIAEAQRRIIAALRAKDADEARRWMRRHVLDFKRGYELAGISAEERISV
jgi:GntR family transcriptional regulator, transcriptional repressor for pyruvate dehydrogenase complex